MRDFTPSVTMQLMPESSGEENANLFTRGVNEARRSELLDAGALLELLEIFGEDGLRAYLVGFQEGEEDLNKDL